ncbi:MAG TPA: CdaR family protein [Terriglobales bacterium]|jgi:YbbR domain-containing protein
MAKFRDYIFHNFGIKVISVFMAVGLWWLVARDPISEIPLDVPIEFHGIPENLEIATEKIPEAQVRLSGPERVIHGLKASDVHLELDMSGARPGERTFDLTSKEVHQPYELDVVQIIPSQLRLTFDTRLTRTLEVRPRIMGTPANGYHVTHINVDPSSVTVRGPQQRVEAASAAVTDVIDVSGKAAPNSFTTHVYIDDPMVQLVRPGPVQVTVIIERVAGSHGEN